MVAQVKTESAAEISGELARGKFTDALLAEMRALIGTELRTEASVNNEYATRLQGAQAAYDVGIQRTCWQIHSLTNWMGDAGFLKAATSQYRSHVYLGDVVRLGGTVVRKEVDADGAHVVHIQTRARNQRDQDVMPGTAVIQLPHRDGAGGPARGKEETS